MHKKSVLVLGASRYQLDTIQSAKRLGYRVVCSDNVPDNPGHALADRSYLVDTTDRESILALARTERIVGAISPCTDVAVTTAAFVADRMGLIGPPVKATEIVCDKLAFRHFLRSNGFGVPSFSALPEQTPDGSKFQGEWWIIKPDCSSGSKGVFIVRSIEELEARLPQTLAFSPNRRAVLERFIDGFQGTCEGILQDGKLAMTAFLDRQTVAPPFVATCGHRIPTSLPTRTQRHIVDTLARLWQLLGVTSTVFDCDFVVSGDDIYILEVSPRLGGNCISALLLKSSGFHLVEYAIRLACNERPLVPQSLVLQPMAVMILGSPESGRVSYDKRALDSLSRSDWIDSLTMDVNLGDPVQAFINGRYRIGECFVRGNSYEDVRQKCGDVLRQLQISVS